MAAEFQTWDLLRECFAASRHVYVPRVLGPGREDMTMLRIVEEDLPKLEPSKWGIPEPPLEDSRSDAVNDGVRVVVVPGVAFTKDGRRLGHGKGYYDTFIEKLIAHARATPDAPSPVVTIVRAYPPRHEYCFRHSPMSHHMPASHLGMQSQGVCLDEQLLDDVPTHAHDVKMDYVVTPSRVFAPGAAETKAAEGAPDKTHH
jgi:5-formyltetrahydrofolate cyclo-ligase